MALKLKYHDMGEGNFGRQERQIKFPVDVWESDPEQRALNRADLTSWYSFVQDCWDHIKSELPSNIGALFFDGVQFNHEENGVMTFDVQYSNIRPTGMTWGHDTTGGTLQVYTSYQSAIFNRSGFTGINYDSLIGMTEDGPEGCERVIPALRLNGRYLHLSGGALSTESNYLAYTKQLASMTGTTNAYPIFGFAAGELLFYGSVGDFRPGVDNEFDYAFIASKNATGLTIAQSITGVAKEGHDYLWIEFRGGKNGDDKWTRQKPVAVHVERIYQKTDFSLLGIGAND